jgi:hypothetical protein
MNDTETLVFLTRAAMLDPRMKRTDPVDQADMAEAWSTVLDDVALDAALIILRQHYRESSDPITPAVIVAGVGAPQDDYPYPSLDEQLEADARARALAAAGVTEAEYLAHEHDVEWLRATFAPRGLETGRG